jgi:hypothetical protein
VLVGVLAHSVNPNRISSCLYIPVRVLDLLGYLIPEMKFFYALALILALPSALVAAVPSPEVRHLFP